ncbi:DMT family transporter [Pseudomonas fontis]|uniref:DMT family transporter n=1 Tax=Pseudomonas fontis TaxID=2942633 RepID=A0ABT5P170_9PSED|nr:DMT family transporter [Pseudomonas fontis]MDD0975493.1 DMT family transporter [Pseudomonas fontis]MDD0994212.1 DMT family transporter [Pseudomonas fontis]
MTTKTKASPQGLSQSAWVLQAAVCLVAFAANSIFCRLALMGGHIDPESFTAIRLLGGGVFLLLVISLRTPRLGIGGSWRGSLCLFLYAYLFSIAYVRLGAGVGALILFGAVQISMFLLAWRQGERFQKTVFIGMLMAFCGLLAMLLPGADAPPIGSALLMVMSGMAWGMYSVLGKKSANPLADTAGNFVRSLPLLVLLIPSVAVGNGMHLSAPGVLYALASGVLASGCGYALWYGLVKQISSQQAATLQLSVPIIASLGGVWFLSEPMSLRLWLVSAVVLGGVALALSAKRRAG